MDGLSGGRTGGWGREGVAERLEARISAYHIRERHRPAGIGDVNESVNSKMNRHTSPLIAAFEKIFYSM